MEDSKLFRRVCTVPSFEMAIRSKKRCCVAPTSSAVKRRKSKSRFGVELISSS